MYSVLSIFIMKILMLYAQESTVVDLSELENSTDMQNVMDNTEAVDLNGVENSTITQNLRNNTGPEFAEARRYGFQQTMTRACKNFAKTYLCVRKCLDYQYDIARSDRNCKCTCYKHAEKATYTMPLAKYTNGSRWMSGAPTMTMFVTPKFPPTYDDEPLPEEESDDKEEDEEKEGESNNDQETVDEQVTDEDGNVVTGEDGEAGTGDPGGPDGPDGTGATDEGDGLLPEVEDNDEEGEAKAEGDQEEPKAEEGGEGEAKEGEK